MQIQATFLAFLALFSFTSASSPIYLNPGMHGAAVEVSQQNVRIYYQDADTSIKEIAPSFPAGTGYGGPDIILPPGQARNNTPIAAIVLQQNNWFGEIHVFYFGTGWNGHQVCEMVWTENGGWKTGPLNSYEFTGRPIDLFLYAFTDGNQVGSSSTIRVGFACDGLGPLCEARYNPSYGWTVAVIE